MSNHPEVNEAYSTTFRHLTDMKDQIGKELGVSDWLYLTQDRINAFAATTDDHQWIHTDPERARVDSPYKTTIAHGFLVLSMASRFCYDAYHILDVTTAINYGLDKVRFPTATPVDSYVRGRVVLKDYLRLPRNGAKLTIQFILEIKGVKKAACIADIIGICYADPEKLAERDDKAPALNGKNEAAKLFDPHSAEQRFQEKLKAIQRFYHTDILPLEEAHWGKDWKEVLPILDEKRERVKELGLWLPQIAQAHGGQGFHLGQFAQVSEWLGRSPYGHYLFNCQAPDAGNMELLFEHGSDAQKEIYLSPLLEGKIRSCFAMTEPAYAGSNPVIMGSAAVRDGDHYILNGHKWFTTGADGAAFVIVMATTDPQQTDPYARASLFIVPMETEGLKIVRNIPVMGETGSGWASHAEIRFTDCRIPADQMIGEEGSAFTMAQQRLGPGRIHHCMRWIGICERAFEMMCHRAVNRQLRPGRNLASQQTIQNWIAESRAEIDAARLLVMNTAKKMQQMGDKAVRTDISVIKFFCADVLQKVLDRSIQVHGALGLTDDTPLAWWYRHERGARIYDGADEVHKSRVARNILKDYQND